MKIPLIGRYNAQNIAGALCAIHALGINPLEIHQAVEHCPSVAGRLERVCLNGTPLPYDVFVDYAHTDDAMVNVLGALRPLTRGRLRVLFGCGGERDATKRPRMAAVACEMADAVVITSDNPRTENPARIIEEILAGVPPQARGRVSVVEDRAAAIRSVLSEAGRGDVVLLAGKGHEDYQIIGAEKRPFDDRLVTRKVLEELVPLTSEG